MTDKANRIVWAAEAVAVFQKHCRTGDEHVIADLICDLGHLAALRAALSMRIRGDLRVPNRRSVIAGIGRPPI
jgi:hypothetical protein